MHDQTLELAPSPSFAFAVFNELTDAQLIGEALLIGSGLLISKSIPRELDVSVLLL